MNDLVFFYFETWLCQEPVMEELVFGNRLFQKAAVLGRKQADIGDQELYPKRIACIWSLEL